MFTVCFLSSAMRCQPLSRALGFIEEIWAIIKKYWQC
ncbi:acetyltransferase [Vibrio anguillarum]|uniref:Acetyltransferase n=1 Tax=Vibrio anguillarum TaxID=55601 RepID=A0AAW4BEY8_VIBAN|nr:acetyltransferase [Vibrio anguillarum]